MNERLAEFLMSLVRDPEKLEAFNDDDDNVRTTIVNNADLSAEEKEALLSGDSSAILSLLQADGEDRLTWVGIPRIKFTEEPPRIKFTVGFALFANQAGAGASASAAKARTSKGGKTVRGVKRVSRTTAKRSSPAVRASKSQSKAPARASKSRKASKRRR